MTDLISLDLPHNSLEGALQSEVGHLENLEILNLSNNLLMVLSYELGNLSNLKLLDVSGNSYSEADLNRIRSSLPTSAVIKTE